MLVSCNYIYLYHATIYTLLCNYVSGKRVTCARKSTVTPVDMLLKPISSTSATFRPKYLDLIRGFPAMVGSIVRGVRCHNTGV